MPNFMDFLNMMRDKGVGSTPPPKENPTLWNTIVPKVATTLGVGGASLLRLPEIAANFLRPPEDMPFGKPHYPMRDLLDENMKAFIGAWGLDKGGGVPPNTAVSEAKTPNSPVPTAKIEGGSREGGQKFSGDIYDALQMMSDKNFKQFVDDHKTDIPGIGYVEGGKGKNGFQRVIERPEKGEDGGGGGNMNLPAMSVSSLATLIHSLADKSKGVAAQEQNQVYREGLLADKQERTKIAKEAENQKKVVDWENRFGKSIDPMTGAPSFNQNAAVVGSLIDNIPIPEQYQGLAEKHRKSMQSFAEDYQKANPKRDLTKQKEKDQMWSIYQSMFK
ncbi:MAG: hypothetical protein LLG40_13370 [Deltaproteobacteria bacterium]|nr:hypothetical protein [Deltaproteobacteria bacterium]